MEPTEYSYPSNPKIKLVDIPGIGSRNLPDLKTYCKKLEIEKYDTFIIMASERFTNHNLDLAKRLASINKPYFFVRSKIDVDYRNEKRKDTFDEREMLEKIRADCSKNLQTFLRDENDIFLISNELPNEWDYPRLTDAISKNLPHRKKEAFCLSIYALSKDILKEKVKTLKGNL